MEMARHIKVDNAFWFFTVNVTKACGVPRDKKLRNHKHMTYSKDSTLHPGHQRILFLSHDFPCVYFMSPGYILFQWYWWLLNKAFWQKKERKKSLLQKHRYVCMCVCVYLYLSVCMFISLKSKHSLPWGH